MDGVLRRRIKKPFRRATPEGHRSGSGIEDADTCQRGPRWRLVRAISKGQPASSKAAKWEKLSRGPPAS